MINNMQEPISTSQVRVNKVDSPNGKIPEIASNGMCAGYVREFADGGKYLAFVSRYMLEPCERKIVMDVEEWFYNINTATWNKDIVYTRKYDQRTMNVGMNVLVRATDGKYQMELSDEEFLAATTAGHMIPEFMMFWVGLIEPHVLEPTQIALEKRWELDFSF